MGLLLTLLIGKLFCLAVIAFFIGFKSIYGIWKSKKEIFAYCFAFLGILCYFLTLFVLSKPILYASFVLYSLFNALCVLLLFFNKKLPAILAFFATFALCFYNIKTTLEFFTYVLTGAIIVSVVMEFFNKTRTDKLTKVYNRYGQEIELERQLRQYKREKSDSFYIFYCDLDKFKEINDTWGHDEGDYVLKSVAAALTKVGEKFDAEVFRNGGDEFILITETCEDGLGTAIAQAVEKEVAHIKLTDGTPIHISVGYKKYNGEKIDDFIDSADKKLYEAKHAKKN